MTGAPTDECQPISRAAAAACAGRARVASSREGRRVSKIEPRTVPSSANRVPTCDVAPVRGPAADRGNRAVGLVARESGSVGGNQLGDLGAHGFEHLGRRRARATSVATRRSAACSSASRVKLLVRLAVRDRGRHQLGELCEPVLEVGRGAARAVTTSRSLPRPGRRR